MLILSAILYIVIAGLLCLRVFRSLSLTRVVMLFFMLTVSVNILVVQVLSLLRLLDNPLLYLLVQFILCLVAGLLLVDPRKRFFKESLPALRFDPIRPRGWEWLPGVLIAAVLLLSLYIGALAPINNSDSLHTHLLRVYYWIQHGSLASWNGTTVTQLNYPVNISIQGVWLFLLGGSERLFYLIQWLALAAAVCAVYEIAVLLGATRKAGLTAALISLCFPVVLLQTYSYQGDAFVASLALISTCFLVMFIKSNNTAHLVLSLLPLAVALGAKQTAFLFLPFYGLALVFLLLRKHLTWRTAFNATGIFLVFFAAFSSYKFIQNALERDRHESDMFAGYRYNLPFSRPDSARQYTTNAARYLYQGFSIDGMAGRWKLGALTARENAFRSLYDTLGIDPQVQAYISKGDEEYFSYTEPFPLNEDAAWFGPLSILAVPLSVIIVLAGKDRQRKRYLWFALTYLILVFILISVLISGWSPTNGRYLILPLMVLAPLFFVLVPQKRVWSSLVCAVLSISAFYLGLSTLLINDSRPLVTQASLYAFQERQHARLSGEGFFSRATLYLSDRVIEDLALTSPNRRDIFRQSYYENLFHQSPGDITDIEFINAAIPSDAPLYLYMRKNIIEYALFGVNKTRDLQPVSDLSQVPPGAFVLVDKGKTPPPDVKMTLLAENGNFSIYIK